MTAEWFIRSPGPLSVARVNTENGMKLDAVSRPAALAVIEIVEAHSANANARSDER